MTDPFQAYLLLPTLFKKTSVGAIQFWRIWVEDTPDVSLIHTQYGQVGTESPQLTTDQILQGKNLGKRNETSRLAQAQAEVRAKWEKQKKKGYVETIEAAEAGEVDDLVQGGIVPMLAHEFAKHGHKMKFPAFLQPKLNGMRCIAILQDGKCTLWSRQRNPVLSVPHIIREIESRFPGQDLILDGELYNHDLMKEDFEALISIVRKQDNVHPNHELMNYYVYDLPSSEMIFQDRWARLEKLFQEIILDDNSPLILTLTEQTEEHEVYEKLNYFRNSGFEGVMIRNPHGLYVNKRSYDLLKLKEFFDDEFPIVGIEEGRGKLIGHVGSFVCQTKNGTNFNVKMTGSTDRLRLYWEDHSLWQGKKLTVKYQQFTGKNNVPLFPTGVAIRDYE